MGDLAPLLSVGGPAGVILAVLIVYMRGASRDRQNYDDNLAAAERRADEADRRREVAEKALDAERAERRRIEDDFSRQIRALEGKVDQLSREIQRLRADVGGGP